MYPWGKIKDETINFLKTNYLMILLVSVIVGFVSSFASGLVSSVISIIQLVFNLLFGVMQASDSSIVQLMGNLMSIFVTFVVSVLSLGVTYFVGGIANISIAKTFEMAKTTGVIDFNYLLYPFKSNFKNIAMVEFKKTLEITIGLLLCVIPGIIRFYQYFMVDYLLSDNPNLPAQQLFEISKNTTNGDKINLFLTNLILVAIVFLGLLACCIGSFFVMPISYVVLYEVYRYLRTKAIANGYVNESYLVTM